MIEPMLALPSSGASNRRPIDLEALAASKVWIGQEKVDGIRAILYSDTAKTRIYNREGREITERFPEVARLRLPAGVLDGEIVARDGRFQTVATRDKQTKNFAQAAKANPCMFLAFDYLEAGGTSLLHLPLKQRLQLMRGVLGRRRNARPVRQSDDLLKLWETVVREGGEGIVAKQKASHYMPGVRAGSWVKFKAVKTITAVAVGYTNAVNGTLGTLSVALVDGERVFPLGKVGTGWTEREGIAMRARLSDGHFFLVEVEALHRTPNGSLRFAVFRGERTDLPIAAASIDQLNDIPLY